ncbi:MAG: hypothetical protein FWG19_01420 [Methanomassiliicoccaceae archaeon]|nr:hypothetical protein [Methanomassiliicoccaceae archaeon]
MDTLMFAAVSAAMVAIVLIVLFLVLRTRSDTDKLAQDLAKRERETEKEKGKKTPEDICGICFGSVTKADMIARCACGQVFHDGCAEATGNCPYCERPYDELKIEEPVCVRCPSCGSDVVGSVCGCGALVGRDGIFTCVCGNVLNVNDPVCGKCGKEYEIRIGRKEE